MAGGVVGWGQRLLKQSVGACKCGLQVLLTLCNNGASSRARNGRRWRRPPVRRELWAAVAWLQRAHAAGQAPTAAEKVADRRLALSTRPARASTIDGASRLWRGRRVGRSNRARQKGGPASICMLAVHCPRQLFASSLLQLITHVLARGGPPPTAAADCCCGGWPSQGPLAAVLFHPTLETRIHARINHRPACLSG